MLVKMKDICTKVGSGATPKGGNNAYIKTGISLIRSQNIHDFYFSHDGLAHINDEQAAKLNGVRLEEDDVLLNITGDSVARACKVDNSVLPARVNQHVCIVRGDKRKVLSSYVLYYLQMKKPELLMMASSGATRNALTKGMIEELELDLPSLQEQKKIVSLLDDIQCKILNNNRINRNLSEQCDAIYRDQFITKSDSSWTMGYLSDLITVKYGKDHKKLEDGNIPCYGSGGVMRYVERPIYDHESVLIPRKGTLNNVMYVNVPFWSVDTMFYTVMKISNVAKFVYHYVKGKDLASMNAGSAVPSMTVDILNAMELQIPSSTALAEFETIVQPLYKAMKDSEIENKKLAELRDTLLPKLMSGELDVSDLDI